MKENRTYTVTTRVTRTEMLALRELVKARRKATGESLTVSALLYEAVRRLTKRGPR